MRRLFVRASSLSRRSQLIRGVRQTLARLTVTRGLDKRNRKRAVFEERTRRWRSNEAASPLSRELLTELLDYLAEHIVADGHDGTFGHTLAWLSTKGLDPSPVTTFLQSHRWTDDFAVAISGDPCLLFGPTPERLARMPIERKALEELLSWLDEKCQASGCDNTRRFTREWLQKRGLPVATTEFALLAQGGGCDCEVVLNVDPENIYP
jgi:hypothetical protein